MRTDLLQADITHLSQRRGKSSFSKPEMTLDQKLTPEWYQILEKDYTTEEWNKVLRLAERCSPATYLAAKKACQGRDSFSLKQQERREAAANLLDAI